MLHRPRAALLAALLSLLTAAPALAQGFPATMGPNTVYGRLGVSRGPGQAISFAQLRTALGFVAGGGTVTSIGCGNGLSGGTITASGSCAVLFGTAAGTAAQGNDPRIVGALQSASNLSDLTNTTTARANLGLLSMAQQAASGVNITGGSITGLPTCAAASDACPKSYIDLLSAGFRLLPEVRLATAAVLPNTPTYANGTAGVGATLTAGANAALTVDGTAVVSGNSILVKDQVSTTGCTVANAGCQNGIYTVTTVGDGSNAWVLTRRTDFDTAAEMLAGSFVTATAGSANVGRSYSLASTVSTVGTTAATFNLLFIQSTQFLTSGSDLYRAAGNLGLGGAPGTWDGLFTVLQTGNAAFGNALNAAEIFGNLRVDGSVFKYLATGFGTFQIQNASGAYDWYTAPSGSAGATATVTKRMSLTNGGALQLYDGAATAYAVGPALRQVATRCYVPSFFSTTNKQVMSRSRHRAQDTVHALQVLIPNYYVDGASNGDTYAELGTGATATVTASIEYPAGTFTQVKFSGSASGTVPDGGTLLSDSVSVTIPEGAFFFARIYFTNTAGTVFFVNGQDSVRGEATTFGASGVSDQTMSGTVLQTSGANMLFPSAIIGLTRKRSVLLIGDSRTSGYNGDVLTSYANQGYLARAIGASVAYINAGVPGDRTWRFLASHTNRLALKAYADVAISGYGLNDFGDGHSAATVYADLVSVWSLFDIPILQTTIGPSTTSTDGWTTVGNQTPVAFDADRITLNTAIRLEPIQLRDYIDTALILESSGNSGRWTPGYTSDGTHENYVGAVAVRNSGYVESRLLQALR